MIRKTSIRYFLGKPVRAIWDDELSEWWFSATDIVSVLVETDNARRYWNTIKSRHNQLSTNCRQHKLYSDDGKKYLTDTLSEKGIKELALLVKAKNRETLQKWLSGSLDPIDTQSKNRAYELFDSNLIKKEDIGKTKSLLQIHSYLFSGLYDFAGKIRTKTISKGGFVFANGDFLPMVLKGIDKMADDTFEEIVNKYIEMNIAHPFMEGNGRSTRIWLDYLLKERLGKCVDWSKIEKNDYLAAMKESPVNVEPLFNLLNDALSSDIKNRRTFMKGIDYSYYYEEEEDV